MSNDFKITISAVDKATATVRKVNDAMAKITAPFENAHKSFGGLGAALTDNPIAKSLGHISKASLGAARSIGSIATPIAAITGVGSVAGIAMLADRWAKFGRSVTYASQQLGISTSKLQQYQGVAELAGISTEGMVSGLGALGTTMEDARWGRNQGALMMLNKLGIGLKKTKDGAWDVNAEFMAVAKVMTSDKLKNNPWAQSLVASELGMSSLLPLLRQGTAGIKKYQDMQAKLGYISSPKDIQNANAFAVSLAGLKISAEGLGQSIMDKTMPAIQPFIDGLSKWIGKDRELISNDVAAWFKAIGDQITKVDWKTVGTDVTGFFTNAKGSASELKESLDDVVAGFRAVGNVYHNLQYFGQKGGALDQAFGGAGYSSADSAMYASQHANDPAFVARRNDISQNDTLAKWRKKAGWKYNLVPDSWAQADYQDHLNDAAATSFLDPSSYRPIGGIKTIPGGADKSKQAVAFFRSQGWTLPQAAGIAANLSAESGFNPGAIGDNGAAYGIGQWHKDRQDNFAKWAGHTIIGSSLEEQERFMQYEITKGAEKAGGDQLRNAPYAYLAGASFSRNVERPADAVGEADSRGELAKTIAAQQGPYSSGVASIKGGAVQVDINLKNAPPGTTAKATATGNATAAAPRIGYSTVGVGA